MYVALALIAGLAGAMEVAREPVAIVLKYPNMQQISLAPADVMIYSDDIPQVETVTGAQVTFSQRSMAEMVAANVPEPTDKPTRPNEKRNQEEGEEAERLDHTPPFNGTVTGDVSIVKSGPNERIVLISNIRGDGIMQVLIKGDTAKTASGAAAKPVLNSPKLVVRNTKSATNVGIGGAAEPKALAGLSAEQRSSLDSHFKGKLPANLKVVSEAIIVK